MGTRRRGHIVLLYCFLKKERKRGKKREKKQKKNRKEKKTKKKKWKRYEKEKKRQRKEKNRTVKRNAQENSENIMKINYWKEKKRNEMKWKEKKETCLYAQLYTVFYIYILCTLHILHTHIHPKQTNPWLKTRHRRTMTDRLGSYKPCFYPTIASIKWDRSPWRYPTLKTDRLGHWVDMVNSGHVHTWEGTGLLKHKRKT